MAGIKFMILAAAMAAMVVITHATIITTEVEIDDDSNPIFGRGKCERQLQSKWPNHCEEYMMEEMRPNQGRGYFNQCCNELKMMDRECQCEAMKKMVQQMQKSEREEMMDYEMMEQAMKLPMMCGTMQSMCPMRGYRRSPVV
ncbi:unnamed protein product [Amaranthus hypochondriacus]